MTEQLEAAPRPRAHYQSPQVIEVGGLPVALRRAGNGEPVLFLHGAGLTRMWLPFYERMSRRVDFIAPEHPGLGETPRPDWLDDFEDLVIHYDALLDVLGLDGVHLVGYSLGSWIAAEYASFHAKRLRSLTLIAPVGLRIDGKPLPNMHAMPPEQLVSTLFGGDPRPFAEFLPDGSSPDEIVHQYGEAATLARLTWSAPYNLKLERRLQRVTCPALVIGAANDQLVPAEMAERYAQVLGAQTQVVAQSGHALVVEQPDTVARHVTDFIEGAVR